MLARGAFVMVPVKDLYDAVPEYGMYTGALLGQVMAEAKNPAMVALDHGDALSNVLVVAHLSQSLGFYRQLFGLG